MKDHRSVDDLSIEELERILRIKKQLAREERLRKFRQTGRALSVPVTIEPPEDLTRSRRPIRLGILTSRALFLLEISAVAGLLYLAYDFWQARETINEEVKLVISSESAPTAMPTPIITALILPGGHTPPTDPGGARPMFSSLRRSHEQRRPPLRVAEDAETHDGRTKQRRPSRLSDLSH